MTVRFKWGELDADGWPKVWPWLTEDDFGEFEMEGEDGRLCINGAICKLFLGSAWALHRRYQRARAWGKEPVGVATLNALGETLGIDASKDPLVDWNNTTSRKERARVWRQLGRRLGYSGNYTLREVVLREMRP